MARHFVGIIPLAKPYTILDKIWDDGFIDVGENINAVQAAVLECASAGCHSIWINADYAQIPLLKSQIGFWVEDPIYFWRKFEFRPHEKKRIIPIYYSWNHQKDVGKRDSYWWGILNAASVASRVARNFSEKFVPDKFFVSFPFAATSIWQPQRSRDLFKLKTQMCFTLKGKSFMDDLMLAFTFSQKDLKESIKLVKRKGTGFFSPASGFDDENWNVPLPKEQRYSARKFNLSDLFSFVNIEEYEKKECSFYYPITSWDEYVTFLKSDNVIRSPKSKYFYNRAKERIINYEEKEQGPDYSFSSQDE
jgi:hypothetical protein|tara:strand:+ start:1354 stop:2271 length:918 start_codon:yes stop_codon:yes gene_type:complete